MVSSADIARILERPAGPKPVQAEALTKEEVEDPSKLPFASVDKEPHRVRLPTFHKVIAGFYRNEANLSIQEHDASPDEWGLIVYSLVHLVMNAKPSSDDFTNETFIQALELLNADEEWVNTTRESISNLFSDFNEAQASVLIAMTRLFAIADDGYDHSIWSKPFWVPPPGDDVFRKVRQIFMFMHYCMITLLDACTVLHCNDIYITIHWD
jgi:hypothetical protein